VASAPTCGGGRVGAAVGPYGLAPTDVPIARASSRCRTEPPRLPVAPSRAPRPLTARHSQRPVVLVGSVLRHNLRMAAADIESEKWWLRADGSPAWAAPKGTPIRAVTRRIVSLLAAVVLAPMTWKFAADQDWIAVAATPLAIALGYVWRDFDVR
jgi:hypothetical protein